MDLADMADIEIEGELKACLSLAQSNAQTRGKGYALTCEVCDEPIPAERHKLLPGCTTCIDCENLLEQANRLQGKSLGTWWY
jgi:phage/conjugal plasmid C-4 type zinc finger TraR family protein